MRKDFTTKFTVSGAQAVITAAIAAGPLFSTPDLRADAILRALAKADLVIVPKPLGDAEAVREAVRTGNWEAVS